MINTIDNNPTHIEKKLASESLFQKVKSGINRSKLRAAIYVTMLPGLIGACNSNENPLITMPTPVVTSTPQIVEPTITPEVRVDPRDLYNKGFLDYFGLPAYDFATSLPEESQGKEVVNNDSVWKTINVGGHILTFNNSSSYDLEIDSPALNDWFQRIGITDTARSQETPYFYAFHDQYSNNTIAAINNTLDQPGYAGYYTEGVPSCLTAFNPTNPKDNNLYRYPSHVPKFLLNNCCF